MSDFIVTPGLVKDLREKTGVGLAKCKEALEHSKGDIEEAISYLRKLGISSAAKKEGRSTTEGTVVFASSPSHVAIVEVDAETDFVVKNDQFAAFAKAIAEEVCETKPSSLEAFLQQKYSKDPNITIDQFRSLLIQKIGENIIIKRLTIIPKKNGESVGIYSHMGGKILTAVTLQGSNEEALAKDVAMHVAASSPDYVSPEHVPQDILQKEKEIAREQIKGKPENILEKILQGKINAFYDQTCLTKQKYIKDDSISVEEFVKKEGSLRGKDLRIVQFLRWAAGKDS